MPKRMTGPPRIFAVKRGSMDDGDGIRTVLFLKGCPLRCSWCHNPQSHSPDAELELFPERCTACGRCSAACPTGALCGKERPAHIDSARCRRHGTCADACVFDALRFTGTIMDSEEALPLLLEDRAFYNASGGGVTFSGGEPLLYPEYVGSISSALRRQGVGVCIETCGHFDHSRFMLHVAPHIDRLYFDIKLADGEKHRLHTGRGNGTILGNLKRLVAEGVNIVPRTPLIPGITDTEENLRAISVLLEECGLASAHILLPYNGSRPRRGENLLRPVKETYPTHTLNKGGMPCQAPMPI